MKVALIGSAPASVRLAPYHDPAWKIWACSPGTYGVIPRCDAFFEMHLWEPGAPWFSPEYVQFLTALPGRGGELLVGNESVKATIPGAIVYPWRETLEEFDPNHWFCSSSLFWMMARAIKQGATTIGFWGVDMAAGEEYEMQRAGIHYLTYIARSRGIEVGTPAESDLFTPRFKYGVDEWTHSYRKVRARREELQGRMAAAEAQARALLDGSHFLKGAIEDLNYMHNTWADKADHCGPRAIPARVEHIEFTEVPVV